LLAGDQLLAPVVDGDRRLSLRLLVVVAQAGVTGAAATQPGQLEGIEEARSAADQDERDERAGG